MGEIISLIHFKGKVGNVIGRSGEKGRMNIMEKPTSYKNPQTPAQMAVRAKLKLASQLAALLGEVGRTANEANGLSRNRRGQLVKQLIRNMTVQNERAKINPVLGLVNHGTGAPVSISLTHSSNTFTLLVNEPFIGPIAKALLIYDVNDDRWYAASSYDTSIALFYNVPASIVSHDLEAYAYAIAVTLPTDEQTTPDIIENGANMMNLAKKLGSANVVLSGVGKFAPMFENNGRLLLSYEEMYKANTPFVTVGTRVYLTKPQYEAGAVVAAPYLISRGSLAAINVTVDREGRTSSSILLGDENVIDANTTVADFSEWVIEKNPDFKEGDVIWFVAAHQSTMTVTGYPTLTMVYDAVVLNTTDTSKLYSKVAAQGFVARDGRLSMSQSVDGGCAWIHQRGNLVSSQTLIGENSILENYVTEAARQASIASFNGYVTPVDTNTYYSPDANAYNDVHA